MKRKTLVTGLLVMVVVLATMASGISAATEPDIEKAIENGVAWLVSQQNPDGSWGGYEQAAHTCFALVKLEERAYDLGYKSPFDPAYPYSDNVVRGWKYIFGVPHAHSMRLSVQWHGASGDNPDTNGNGYGVYFDTFGSYPNYTTGICLMALAASRTPGRPNDGGLDFNGDGNPDTFKEIAQDTADWLAFAQSDFGWSEGGWGYGWNDNADDWADQSNSGYSVLGLAYAEEFGCTVPAWVSTELNVWIGAVQNPDGGSGYQPGGGSNELRTGNLIFEMTFVGDAPGAARFQNALAFIENQWRNGSPDPGWGYNVYPASYQAMYTLMKGLQYSHVDLIDTDGDGVRDDDWFNQEPPASPPQDFASVLVTQQNADGSWPACYYGDNVLCTSWALLTLEKVAPPPPVIEVDVDIKPGSCPNPFNIKSKGVLPVAVLGTEDFDVTTIDPATILLTREDVPLPVGVSPLRWSYEDVGTPFMGELCDCHDLNGDGYMDLTLKFDSQAVGAALGLAGQVGNTIPLVIIGTLKEEAGGTPIKGSDCVRILQTGK